MATESTKPADWSAEEKLDLIRGLKQQCPDKDKMSFSARINKIDWKEVKVGDHTPDQCKEAWTELCKQVRKFRTLEEMTDDAEKIVLHPDKFGKGKGKLRHPDQPVRPLTAYFQFLHSHRDKIKAEYPDLNAVELNKYCSQKWQSLDPDKQQKYIKKYQKKYKQYQADLSKFLEDHPELNNKQTKPSILTPYNVFFKAKMPSYLAKHPDLPRKDVQKKLKAKYIKLSPEKKKKWIQKAHDAVPEFDEEVRQYQMCHPDYEPPSKKVRLTKEEAVLNGDDDGSTGGKKKLFPGAPVKPPISAFHLYIKKFSDMEGPMKEKMTVLAIQWKQLGDKQSKYIKRLAKQRHRYQQELEEFKQTLSEEQLEQFEQSLLPKKSVRKRRMSQSRSPDHDEDSNLPTSTS